MKEMSSNFNHIEWSSNMNTSFNGAVIFRSRDSKQLRDYGIDMRQRTSNNRGNSMQDSHQKEPMQLPLTYHNCYTAYTT